MKNRISLHTKVHAAINAIDAGTVLPIVDTECGPIILLNTANKELGNIQWTTFDRESFFPLESWTCRFGAIHTIQQVLFDPMPMRVQLDKILDQYLPDCPWVDFLPMILPGCGLTYPTEVQEPVAKTRKRRTKQTKVPGDRPAQTI